MFIACRLHVHPHNAIKAQQRDCCLCGNNFAASGHRGGRSNFCCDTCNVHLCLRKKGQQRKSCWVVWHETKRLSKRTRRPPSA